MQWLEYSFYYYENLQSYSGSGISDLDGYIFSNISEDNVNNHFLKSILPVYRPATIQELNEFTSWSYGSYFKTIRIACCSFIPWAISRYSQNSGHMRKCKVKDFSELANEFDIVFNCTGFGSKYLCSDRNMVPIRGQLIEMHAPWITKFYYRDFDTFIVPLGNGNITLGTSKDYENYDLSINKRDSESIIERCASVVPSIRRAKIIKEWVGLRPHRHILRIEIEKRQDLIIVHNYGHGGFGITSAPGTVNYAIGEFRKLHLYNSKL